MFPFGFLKLLINNRQSRGAYRAPSLFDTHDQPLVDRSPSLADYAIECDWLSVISCNHHLRHLWAVESTALRSAVVRSLTDRKNSQLLRCIFLISYDHNCVYEPQTCQRYVERDPLIMINNMREASESVASSERGRTELWISSACSHWGAEEGLSVCVCALDSSPAQQAMSPSIFYSMADHWIISIPSSILVTH